MPHRDRPITELRASHLPALPGAAARRCAPGVYWSRELIVPGLTFEPRIMKALAAGRAPPPGEAGRRPGAAREADSELRDRLQAHPAVQRLVSGAHSNRTSSWSPTASAEIAPDGIVTADGRLHEVDTIVLATGFKVTDISLAHRIRDADGVLDGRHLERQPAGLPGHVGGRLPEPVLRHRPQHRPRPQLAGLHDRGAAELRARRAAPDAPARRDPDRGPARRAGRLQRIHPAPPGPHGVEHRRLLELVPRRDGPQHHDLALLHVALLAEDPALRPRAVRADERRRRGPTVPTPAAAP